MSAADHREASQRAAELAARTSYGRLVALLAFRWRDVAAAEDALGEAFASALRHWPASGVPASPDAWLMTAAHRELLQRARHDRMRADPSVTALFEAEPEASVAPSIPDDRLKLLFVCAHPALSPQVHAPLMLQTVLGLDAATIADAFLVSPRAMAQRLVRAKARIRDAGLRFEEPEGSELASRLDSVLEAIYSAYTIGRHRSHAATGVAGSILPAGLIDEALFLCRVVIELQPLEPEPLGLLALMLHCEGRRPAQFDGTGRFTPLLEQDTALWRHDSLADGDRLLWRAAKFGRAGPFQIEAAIQSAHSERGRSGQTPWAAIASLYEQLLQMAPGIGACVGHAVAVAEAGEVPRALALLDALPDAIPSPDIESYQPWWIARAHVLRLARQMEAARVATTRAIGLTEDPRVREFLATASRAEGPASIGG